jgi:hypothetical protein
MGRDSTWTNQDGLVVGFGPHTVDNDVAGVYGGTKKVLSVEYDLADLSDTFAATTVKPQDPRIPRGSYITRATIQTLVAATSGGAATLDVGTWGVGLATEVVDDADGLVADVTIAEMTSIGETHVCDGALILASDGVGVGATSNSDVVIAPSYETAVFTAGRIRLTVEYTVPGGSTGGSIAN